MQQNREPAVAGMFYPGDAQRLRTEVLDLLAQASPKALKKPRFLIVPHAGYSYSGQVAAEAFIEIEDYDYQRIYLLGPSHHYYFTGMVGSDYRSWSTPLGEMEAQPPGLEGLEINNRFHQPEHSLEVQLPFLQILQPQAQIIPLLCSGGLPEAKDLAQRLAGEEEDILMVISSDFNHVGPRFGYLPKEHGFETGAALDQKIIEVIEGGEIAAFRSIITQYNATVCGALPILVALYLSRAWQLEPFQLKAYDNSGNMVGGPDSVGYAALYA